MYKFTRQLTAILMATCFFVCLAVADAGAIGSGEKSPEETAAEKEKKATEKYNNGVGHMEKAREKVAAGDSTYAFNYRATSDAKARKEYEKAAKDFEKTVELKPSFAEAYNNLGYCYRKLGELQKSLTAYDNALALDSTFARAIEYRGETYLALGLIEEAMSALADLKRLESPYQDTLMASIELYRLQEIDKQMNKKDED